MRQVDMVTALDECIVDLENGLDVDTCLARFPELREELAPLLMTSQSVARADIDYPQFRPLSRQELSSKLANKHSSQPYQRWPVPMKLAAIGAAATIVCSVLSPELARMTSLIAGSGWLYWWATDFRPKRFSRAMGRVS